MIENYIWIIGGGHMQIPVVEEAHKMGYKVAVSDVDEKCPCAEMADIFYAIDIYDIPAHIKAALAIKDSVKAVVAAGIDAPVTAARLAEVIGVPSAGSQVSALLHNKHDMRKLLQILQFPVPRWWYAPKGEKTVPFAKTPFDVVVKPCENSGSRGVSLISKESIPLDLFRAIELAQRTSRDGAAIIEERFTGTEHTVETLFNRGKFVPCFITDRLFTYDNGKAVETGLRNPSTLPPYIQRQAYDTARSLGEILGITDGAMKLDIMVTDHGVRIIEATTRLSGGWDSQVLVPAATGKNIIRAYIQVCAGEKMTPECLRATKDRVAISESLWPPSGMIKAIEGVDEARKLPGVEFIHFRKAVGDVVEGYDDCASRVCWIITSGDSYGMAKGAMEEAKSTIKVVTE